MPLLGNKGQKAELELGFKMRPTFFTGAKNIGVLEKSDKALKQNPVQTD